MAKYTEKEYWILSLEAAGITFVLTYPFADVIAPTETSALGGSIAISLWIMLAAQIVMAVGGEVE